MRHALAAAAAFVLMLPTIGLAQDAAAVEKGAKVYAAQKCSLCHAIAGKGNKQHPLDGVGAKLSADDLRKWITSPKEMEAKLATKPKTPMKAYPNLPKEDLDALVAYLLSLK
jgi:mono/diheme cytochrome c family protein